MRSSCRYLPGDLFFALEFAVLAGILLSFAVYIIRTSVPRVFSVLPTTSIGTSSINTKAQPAAGVLDILGDCILGQSAMWKRPSSTIWRQPTQRFVLLRMHSVQQCDFSGSMRWKAWCAASATRRRSIHGPGAEPVLDLMKTPAFAHLGSDHFWRDTAISHLFTK